MPNPRSFRDYANERSTSVTIKQRKLIDNFTEIVREWDAGNIPLTEARNLTDSGRARNLVFTHMSPDHPDYATWRKFLDALHAQNTQIVDTKFGTFTMNELLSYGAKFETRVDVATGKETQVITFPEFKESNPEVTKTEAYLREQRRQRADRSDEPSTFEEEWYEPDDEPEPDE